MGVRIDQVRTSLVRAAPFTNWIFVEILAEDGARGLGEASLPGDEERVATAVDALSSSLSGRDVLDIHEEHVGITAGRDDVVASTVWSALEQALWDLKARMLGVPLCRLLGRRRELDVPLYANINRASLDRSPDAMAGLARSAIEQGYGGVKCAPLDGVTRAGGDERRRTASLAEAVERVRAIRQAIGPEPRLMVDCHWRLTPESASTLAAGLEPLNVTWLEDPFPEEEVGEWVSLRSRTSIPLAGGERATSLAQIAGSLRAGQYQIACPDVRHIGGIAPLWHAAHLIHALGAEFAPHNPRGPVGTLASAHVCVAAPDVMLLEYPFGECGWRSELVSGAERIEHGRLVLPDGPGIGARIDESVAAAHPYARVPTPREVTEADIW